MKNKESILFDFLLSIGISPENYEHDAVFTVEEALKIAHALPPWGHCKNLFLKDKRRQLWLVVALFDTKINLKSLAKQLEAPELRFASHENLADVLGVIPGAVTPLALINDANKVVRVVLDERIFEQEKVGMHPLRNTATVFMAPQELKRFINECGNSLLISSFVQGEENS